MYSFESKPYPNNLVEGMPTDIHLEVANSSKVIAVTGICSFLALTGAQISSEIAADDFFLARDAYAYFTEQNCGSVPSEVHDRVEGNLTNRDNANDQLAPATPNYAEFLQTRQLFFAAANESDMELVDYMPYISDLYRAENIDDALEALNNFTQQYGIKTEIENGYDLVEDFSLGYAAERKDEDIVIEDFKNGAYIMMKTLFAIPKEVLQFSKVDKINIVKRIDMENQWGQVVGQADIRNGEINIVGSEFIYSSLSSTLRHEIGHHIDLQTCGIWGYVRDPEYQALNSPDFEYGDDQDPLVAYKNTISSYSRRRVIEDKAEMYDAMIGRLSPEILDTDEPVIRKKYRLLLDRLENKVPGSSEYLARVSPIWQ